MASAGKKKTTMAKLTRESTLRKRRQEKEARKRARKDAAAHASSEPEAALPEGHVVVVPAADDTVS
ncbi:MAG: hypothetical protein ACRDL5_18585 [Solirubrobacteraceae bacterium]